MNPNTDLCAICLDDLKEKQAVPFGQCGHLFHKTCLTQYLSRIQNAYIDAVVRGTNQYPYCMAYYLCCPLCRRERSGIEPCKTAQERKQRQNEMMLLNQTAKGG